MALAILLFIPMAALGATSTPAAGVVHALPAPHGAAPTPMVAHPTAQASSLTFPRTVLVESFTGVWCIHCPAESQAFYLIDGQTTKSYVSVGEIHSCAFAPGQGPCYDNFVPSDATTADRGTFYKVCGYPDVFFDGLHDACGATNSISGMENQYNDEIANASAVTANISISQNSELTSSGVTDQVNITSEANGTFNAIVYLIEHIDKLNQSVGYGPHDVINIVRETMYNRPVTLIPGTNTQLTVTEPLNTTYNTRNLSVIAFVQANSTKQVLNTNWATVSTLHTALSENKSIIFSQGSATVTVRPTNSTTGAPLVGATVQLSVTPGGSLIPLTGATGASGTFNATFTAPMVTSTTPVLISAEVTQGGYTHGFGNTTILVNPVVAPDVPTSMQVAAGSEKVALSWLPSASGGAGVTYHIYRASTSSGPFTPIGAAVLPTYVDTTVMDGTSYWYKVSAQNIAGFSTNTSAIAATSVSATPTGLPASVGWWFSIDGLNTSSTTSGSIALYLPSGFVSYSYGASSYAYIASAPSGPLSISGVTASVTATFTPRYADLQGTVNVASATVTFNGQALPVSGGAFGTQMAAGTYDLNVTASGYVAYQTTVTLTPGNLTTVSVQLTAVATNPGGSSSPASSGLSTTEALAIVAGMIVVAAVVIIVMAVAFSSKRKGGRRGGRSPPPAGPSP